MQKALQSLALAMDLAEPEGYFLAILEVGRPVIPLLYEAVQKGIHPEFATRLLEGFKETQPNPLETSDDPEASTRNPYPVKSARD